jgi:hypothetical protein
LPDIRVEFDMVERRDGLAEVFSKSRITATLSPPYSNFMGGITEHRAESVINGNVIGKSFCDFVDP